MTIKNKIVEFLADNGPTHRKEIMEGIGYSNMSALGVFLAEMSKAGVIEGNGKGVYRNMGDTTPFPEREFRPFFKEEVSETTMIESDPPTVVSKSQAARLTAQIGEEVNVGDKVTVVTNDDNEEVVRVVLPEDKENRHMNERFKPNGKPLKDQIVECVMESDKLLTRVEIAEKLGKDASNLSSYITDLVRANRIRRVKHGLYGKPKKKAAKNRKQPEPQATAKPNPAIVARGDLFEYVGRSTKGTRILRHVEGDFLYELKTLEV